MRWIHANENREEQREILDIISADMQVKAAPGADMIDNTWSMVIPERDWSLDPIEKGHYIYSPGTEWGGPVTLVQHNTGERTVTMQGPTWRGLLFRKLILPTTWSGTYVISNEDANAALSDLISNRFGTLIVVSDAITGVSVSGEWAYDKVGSAAQDMLRAYGMRMEIAYDDVAAHAVVSAKQVSDLSDGVEISQDYGVAFTSTIGNITPANHAVVKGGSGLVHVYWTPNGYVTAKPAEWTEADDRSIYVDGNESTDDAEMAQWGVQALQELEDAEAVSIDQLRIDMQSAELGDHLAIRDRVTGLEAEAIIVNKILSISGGRTTIQMDVDTVTEEE